MPVGQSAIWIKAAVDCSVNLALAFVNSAPRGPADPSSGQLEVEVTYSEFKAFIGKNWKISCHWRMGGATSGKPISNLLIKNIFIKFLTRHYTARLQRCRLG
jgi:hypothetical protein